MPIDRSGEHGETPKTPEQMIGETRAERDAYRMSVPFEQIDPQNIPDRHKYHGEPGPLTARERYRLAKLEELSEVEEASQTRAELTKFLAEADAEYDALVAAGLELGEGTDEEAGREPEATPQDTGETGETSAETGEDEEGAMASPGDSRLTIVFGEADTWSTTDPSRVEPYARGEEDMSHRPGDQGSHEALPEADEAVGESAEQRGPERLHAFGNKERPRPPRLEQDLKIDSPDAIIGPYAPTSPSDKVHGVSTFIDPFHPDVELSGKYHHLPPDYEPPEDSGLAIHADGIDIPGIEREHAQPWGHRTIYPAEAMTAAEFARRVAELPWEYAGNKK